MVKIWSASWRFGACVSAFACRASPATVAVSCQPPMVVSLAADSSTGLCLPPGFRQTRPDAQSGSHAAWKRGTPGSRDYAWVAVHLIDSAAAAREWGVPPKPRSMRDPNPPMTVDGVNADSVVLHPMTIAGQPVAVETGLLSGGVSGMRRQPHFRAIWPLANGRWIIIQGRGETTQTLDSLRAALSSFQLSAASNHEAAP